MATMKTTAKRNPITGEPVPAPAYARGKSKNFAGTDRKREPLPLGTVNDSPFPGSTGSKREQRKNAANTLTNRQNRAINNGIDPETGKIKRKGIPTTGEMRREERQKNRGFKDSSTSTAPRKGTVIKNRKVKITKGGGIKKVKMDKSCKGPKSWMD